MKQLYPVFNVVKLTPAPEDPITGRRAEDHLPSIVIDGEAEWEVEKILDSRWHQRKFQYLIKFFHLKSIAPRRSNLEEGVNIRG